MIKIENVAIFGWEAAIRGMRNPKNSWDKSDSFYDIEENPSPINPNDWVIYRIGKNDLALMKTLSRAGSDHAKYLRMINVTLDITAPLYWLKEFDTYKVGTVANSCSTMHKIHEKEFELDDFSHEHLWDDPIPESDDPEDDGYTVEVELLEMVIERLNRLRTFYNLTKIKQYWYRMIQLLPSSYNQLRTVQLNYAVLKNMYHARKNHKLDEWRVFCEWIKTLPYSELITEGYENVN